MKKLLSLVFILMLTVVPAFSAFATETAPSAEGEAAYGWDNNVFYVYMLNMGFAVPDGAVAMTEEEVAAANASPSATPMVTKSQLIAGIATADKSIAFTVAYEDLSANAELLADYPAKLTADMATAMGIDPATVKIVQQPFCGSDSDLITMSTAQGVTAEVNVVRTETGAYVFANMFPSTAVEAVKAFATALLAPELAQ